MSTTPRNDWDTPADGDFASYVERLSAAQTQHPAAPPLDEGLQKGAGAGAPAPGSPRPAPVPDVSAPGLAGKLRSVRTVVLLVLMGQVLAWLFFHKGSLPLLFFTGVVWFILGRAQSALLQALSGAPGGDSAQLARLREQLQRSVHERAKPKKPKKK